ncbi:hypothetical protein AM1BK_36000 [Neobacillus kokaensis]|uniref:Uncharacterized protein n=1 Tax=Neobacillus kokaensis TaxID=2759023 RepID=A0ABQ3N8Q1_9BACI|nr:hypothetical protein AM1BK_36000 [Neobacillus kokaensis]
MAAAALLAQTEKLLNDNKDTIKVIINFFNILYLPILGSFNGLFQLRTSGALNYHSYTVNFLEVT